MRNNREISANGRLALRRRTASATAWLHSAAATLLLILWGGGLQPGFSQSANPANSGEPPSKRQDCRFVCLPDRQIVILIDNSPSMLEAALPGEPLEQCQGMVDLNDFCRDPSMRKNQCNLNNQRFIAWKQACLPRRQEILAETAMKLKEQLTTYTSSLEKIGNADSPIIYFLNVVKQPGKKPDWPQEYSNPINTSDAKLLFSQIPCGACRSSQARSPILTGIKRLEIKMLERAALARTTSGAPRTTFAPPPLFIVLTDGHDRELDAHSAKTCEDLNRKNREFYRKCAAGSDDPECIDYAGGSALPDCKGCYDSGCQKKVVAQPACADPASEECISAQESCISCAPNKRACAAAAIERRRYFRRLLDQSEHYCVSHIQLLPSDRIEKRRDPGKNIKQFYLHEFLQPDGRGLTQLAQDELDRSRGCRQICLPPPPDWPEHDPPKPRRCTSERLDPFDDVVAVGRGRDWHCSGVAVSPQLVLTARHCLPADRILAAMDVREGGTLRTTRQAYVHPESSVDAALLQLAEPLPSSLHARRSQLDTSPPVGVARLIGFGAIDLLGTYGFGRKHHTDLPISGWGCDPLRAALLGCQPDRELVIVGSGGRDTCDGDSGGPVYEHTLRDGPCLRWRLLGITSRPIATSTTRCGGGGVYTRLDQLDGWIREVTNLIDKSKDRGL